MLMLSLLRRYAPATLHTKPKPNQPALPQRAQRALIACQRIALARATNTPKSA